MCCSRSPGLFFLLRKRRQAIIDLRASKWRKDGRNDTPPDWERSCGRNRDKEDAKTAKEKSVYTYTRRVCTYTELVSNFSRDGLHYLSAGPSIQVHLNSRLSAERYYFPLPSWHSPSLLPRHFLQPLSFSTTSIRAIENVYRSREIWRDRVERFDPRLFRTTPRRKISRRASQLFDWHSVSLSCHHHRSGRSLRIYCRHITAGINDCWLILARLFSNSICPLSVVSGIDRQMDRRLDVRRDEQDAIDSQKHLPISSSGAINKEEKANMQSTGRRLMRRVRLLSGCTVSSACCRLAASLQLLSPPSISSQKVILSVFFVPSWCRPLSQSHSPHRFRTLPFEEKRINLSYTGIY